MKNYFPLIVLLLSSNLIFSQPPPPDICPTIVFSYDATGNRIQRNLIVIPCSDVQKTSVADSSSQSVAPTMQVNVYPNPAKDKINVEFSQDSSKDECKIFLYDIGGKIIYSSVVSSAQLQIDVSAFNTGTYLLKIVRGKEYSTYNVLKN